MVVMVEIMMTRTLYKVQIEIIRPHYYYMYIAEQKNWLSRSWSSRRDRQKRNCLPGWVCSTGENVCNWTHRKFLITSVQLNTRSYWKMQSNPTRLFAGAPQPSSHCSIQTICTRAVHVVLCGSIGPCSIIMRTEVCQLKFIAKFELCCYGNPYREFFNVGWGNALSMFAYSIY